MMADAVEAYWQGVVDALTEVDITPVLAQKFVDNGMITQALPGLDDRPSTTNLKLKFIRMIFEGYTHGQLG